MDLYTVRTSDDYWRLLAKVQQTACDIDVRDCHAHLPSPFAPRLCPPAAGRLNRAVGLGRRQKELMAWVSRAVVGESMVVDISAECLLGLLLRINSHIEFESGNQQLE